MAAIVSRRGRGTVRRLSQGLVNFFCQLARDAIDGGQVLDTGLEEIPGLYAAGELVGGLFYGNYPGGTGLMAGAVFGRLAGESAGSASSS